MVPGLLNGLKTALQIRQRSVQHGSSVACSIKTRSGFGFSAFVGTLGASVVLGNGPLILTKNIDAETFLGVKVGVGSSGVINANQHQHRVERHGGECVRSHAMDFAVEVKRDNGDASGEGAHGLPEF